MSIFIIKYINITVSRLVEPLNHKEQSRIKRCVILYNVVQLSAYKPWDADVRGSSVHDICPIVDTLMRYYEGARDK